MESKVKQVAEVKNMGGRDRRISCEGKRKARRKERWRD